MVIPGVHCILVHGTCHGPWVWSRLAPYLPQHWRVTTPDLGNVPAMDHVGMVASLLHRRAGEKLMIVLHSYAGMLIADAIASAGVDPDQVVFLDAFVPNAGETAFELLGPLAARMVRSDDGQQLLPPPPELMGATSAADCALLAAHLTPFPVASHERQSANDAPAIASSTFIRCTQFPGFANAEERAHAAGWQVRRIDTGHDAMLFQPEALATIIADLG
jgi:hypothetical protein